MALRLINALTAQVGPGTHLSDNPTNQELEVYCLPDGTFPFTIVTHTEFD
jgi:hypothetical protein